MLMAIGATIAAVQFTSNFLKGMDSGKAAKKMAKQYAEEAARYRLNARLTRLNGSLNEDINRAKKRSVLASASAALGEAGMGESATTTAALATTSNAYEESLLNDRYQVETEAENYLYQASIADYNARMVKKKSKHRFVKSLVSAVAATDFSGVLNNGK